MLLVSHEVVWSKLTKVMNCKENPFCRFVLCLLMHPILSFLPSHTLRQAPVSCPISSHTMCLQNSPVASAWHKAPPPPSLFPLPAHYSQVRCHMARVKAHIFPLHQLKRDTFFCARQFAECSTGSISYCIATNTHTVCARTHTQREHAHNSQTSDI